MHFFIFLLTLSIPFFSHSQKYFVEQSEVSFYSWAPLEDISAVSNNLEGVVDLNNGNFFFRVPISSFTFPSSLMQKHFNDKYLESHKFPLSTFKGSFKNKISFVDSEKIEAAATGQISIHGVENNISIDTFIETSDSTFKFSSEFYVALKDFKIKIPKIVRMNIADTIKVNVSGRMSIED